MYQLSPYGQTQAQPYNPYANAYQATAYPTSYQTQMPASYTAQPAANDAFYNAAAWRAAMPTPNLTFNYNMGAGGTSPYGQAQTQAYSPYTQAASPYAQYQQPQQYPGMQQYGQYPQANQFSPYATQQQYSPYGQTAGAYPYGQAAGAYGQPGAYNPYAMQPGVNPMGGMGGADMFNPAGMSGMDPMSNLSNPATTGVDNLMTPPPAAPVEKKSGIGKWIAGAAAIGIAIWGFMTKGWGFFDDPKSEVTKVDVKATLGDTATAHKALKEMAKEPLSAETKTSVDAALTAHDTLTKTVGTKYSTESLQKDGEPVPQLKTASEAFDAAHTQVEKQLEEVGKETDSDAKTKRNEHLSKVKEHIESIQKHIGDLTSVANNSATNSSEPEASGESK